MNAQQVRVREVRMDTNLSIHSVDLLRRPPILSIVIDIFGPAWPSDRELGYSQIQESLD